MKLYLKASNFFNGLVYFVLGCEILLFLFEGIPYIVNKKEYSSGGSDTVVAFTYIGPMLILNLIIIPYFLILSINRLTNKKYNEYVVKKIYKKNAILFTIEIVFALFANLIIFI